MGEYRIAKRSDSEAKHPVFSRLRSEAKQPPASRENHLWSVEKEG